METFYVFLVLFLGVLAVFDLSVGVSNDAVNFLNASIGSKAASFRVIMIVAATGILVGAALSNGMMDIARHGIYQPQYFYFSEIMCILVAVMLTDVVLLDIFNSLGMPTSTTVSLVFELLGGTVAYALIKIANDTEGIYHLGNLMNTDKALTVILAIFVSVAIAFIFGTLVQYISRIIFTFNYKQSPAGQLTVTTDENVFPHLRFDVSNGDLQILAEEGDKVYPTRLEVKGSSAELNEVNLAGKVDFTLTGDLRGEDLNINVAGGGSFVADGAVSIDGAELNVAGGGTLRLAQLSGKSVEANAAGGGEMTLKGMTEDGKYNVAGGGKIQADELKAEDVDANVAAGGKIYVYASSSLNASSVAGGRIYYKGNPADVDKSSVLGGGIRKMDE